MVSPRPTSFISGRGLVAHRNLGEADLAGQLRHRPSHASVIAIAMHEDDGDRADAVLVGRLAVPRHAALPRSSRRQHLAVGADTRSSTSTTRSYSSSGLTICTIEQFRAAPGSRSPARRETLGDDQQSPVALALQQRVGGNRRAHLDGGDALRRHAFALPQRPSGRGCPGWRRRRRPRDFPTAACAP